MNNFTFNIPTDIRFGRNQIQCLPEELAKYVDAQFVALI